jgi:hypothetical protein
MSFRLDQLLDKHWCEADDATATSSDGAYDGRARRGSVVMTSPPIAPTLSNTVYIDAETRRWFSLDTGGASRCVGVIVH